MRPWTKWITAIAIILIGISLLALAGAWRLGLLPLLFPQPPGAVPPHVTTGATGAVPGATIQPQAVAPGRPADNTGTANGNARDSRDALRQEIEQRYVTRLQNLAGGYEGKINALSNGAFGEFEAARKSGKVSYWDMASKYISEGNSLEKQCDAQFYAILQEFKDELSRNNLPLDTAVRVQQLYEYAKANRKREILSNAAQLAAASQSKPASH